MAEYGKPTPKPPRKSGKDELAKILGSSCKNLRDRLRKFGFLKSALVFGVITSGYLYWSSSPSEIQGTFTLTDSDIIRTFTVCKGTGGFSDIQAGITVVVKNEKGEIVAKSNLEQNIEPSFSLEPKKCVYPFKISNVPKSSFYIVEVGKRGALTFSRKELAKQD